MAEEDRTFNYNDLNLDFLELSPHKARPVVRSVTSLTSNTSFRPNAFKAKQLAQKVAHNDVLVNQIDTLKRENSAMQQKLKDFQKTASQIQELYENEKKKCCNLQIQFTEAELNSNKQQKRCAQLNNDLEEKKLQLEQLEAQMAQDKGPLSYIELVMKYLKLFHKFDEEEIFNKNEKAIFLDLSKYCEERGCKVPVLKVKSKKKQKRIIKKDKDVQCTLLEAHFQKLSKEYRTQSTQTSVISNNSMQSQTDFPRKHMHTQTSANEEITSTKHLITQAVQTTPIELRSQGTQHISITTTRGTSTSCFIKKHNVGTCFPEPTPVTVMVEELLQLYNVSPLSPISDPVTPLTSNELYDKPTTPVVTKVPASYKSIGTCTYLCNVQRQIDFIPLITAIKRSQSSSPSPCTCDNIKNEAYAIPTPSPSPPPPQSIPLQVSSSGNHNRNSAEATAPLIHNLNNMQPMLNAFTQLPEMQPEIFSTIWQMAGQMFMGLLYPPTNTRISNSQLNRPNNSIEQQQFHNWIYTLYESMQQPPQQPISSHTGYHRDVNGIERSFNLDPEANNTNVIQAINNTSQHEEEAATREVYNGSTNVSTNSNTGVAFGADESTQTDNSSLPLQKSNLVEKNLTDCIFKEPLEIPKRSVKQARKRKTAVEELTYVKKYRDKQARKKRKKEKQKNVNIQVNVSSFEPEYNEIDDSSKNSIELSTSHQCELDFATAVEFCANLCSFNNDADGQSNHSETDGPSSTANASPASTQVLPDIPCDEFEYDKNTETKTAYQNEVITGGRERLEMSSFKEISCLEGNENLKERVSVKVVDVPDVTLPGTDENQCDNLNIKEAILATVPQPETCEGPVKQNTCAINSIFGSDSDDDDFTEVYAKNKQNCENDVESSAMCLDTKKLANSLKSNEIMMKKENKEESFGRTHKAKEGTTANKGEIEASKSTPDFLPSTTFNQNEVVNKNEETQEVVNSVEQILLDLSMSESEDEDKEERSSKPTDNSAKETFDDGEETDEPALVIVEEESDNNNRKRATSESSVASGLDADGMSPNFLSNSIKSAQVNGSDTDISAILDNTIVNDLLASTSSQQLYNSILRESTNEFKERDNISPPRKRGRKRKSELKNVTFCKRSARLRAQQQKPDSEYSSDECLSPPSKKHWNITPKKDDITATTYDAGLSNVSPQRKTLLNALTKEENDKQIMRFAILKQKALESEIETNQSIIEEGNENFDKSVHMNGNGEYENADKEIGKTISAACNNEIEHINNIMPALTPLPMNDINSNISEGIQSCAETCEHNSAYCPSNTSYTNFLSSCPKLSESTSINHHSQLNHKYYETPASPPPHINQNEYESPASNDIAVMQPCLEIPLELNSDYYHMKQRSILQHLINNYSSDIYAIVIGKKKLSKIDSQITLQLEKFLTTTRDRVDVSAATFALALHEEIDDTEIIASLIVDQLMYAPRPEIELNCEVVSVPRKYIGTHLRLISIVLRHLQYKRPEIAGILLAKVENKLFTYQNTEIIKMEGALNLTQLYLLVIPMHKAEYNPARLFIAKCLYYYNVLAYPMIYEVLCWYPTTLPCREEAQYDRSDALITVIQHFLMCMTYNMDTKDLRHKELLSLLRYEYHFEPYKPKALEVLSNLVAKLKAGNLSNLKYAFAIFCKRQTRLVDILLQQQLLPLADEYYKLVQHTNEYDARIAALLECISAVVKPLPLDTDVSLYHSIFERFLVAVQRPVVQEAAVLGILRLQRFGHARCFHSLAHFRPYYSLQMLTSNSLKTFIHKKPLVYWKSLLLQNKQ